MVRGGIAKHTVESVNALVAELHGGACTAINNIPTGGFHRNKPRYKRVGDFRCRLGHTWTAGLADITGPKHSWCCICYRESLKNDPECANRAAAERGWECLTPYTGANSPMRWRCGRKHEWVTTYSLVTSANTGCGECVRIDRSLSLEDAHEIAAERGGRCLSTEFVSSQHHLQWICEFNHTWTATLHCVKHGNSWCSVCHFNNMRYTQHDMDELAAKKGGKCISPYVDMLTPITWQCGAMHTWEARPSNVMYNDTWCRMCNTLLKRTPIEELHAHAAKMGGKCLATEYVSCMTPVPWECKFGHQWMAKYNSLKSNNTWCGHCPNRSETMCRDIFEKLFQKRFPRIRPEWLIGPAGYRLELDGYCEELKLAFEFNGKQHYLVADYWGLTEEDLDKQCTHDLIKEETCHDREILLVTIPYWFETYEAKRDHILAILTKEGFKYDKKNLDM